MLAPLTLPFTARALLLASLVVACGEPAESGSADSGVPINSDKETVGFVDTSGGGDDGTPGPGADTTTPDVPLPDPGAFGAPCESNFECASGYCVEGPVGFLCTATCVSDCPDGYDCKAVSSGSADLSFLCLPRFQKYCTPCAVDANCTGGACLSVDGEDRCAPTCVAQGDCKAGFECELAAGASEGHCLPTTGSCSCYPGQSGGKRSCTSTSELGTCYGVQSCDDTVGWSSCSAVEPGPESCNGVDDDCNGLIDDGLTEGETCENEVAGVGSCGGVRACLGATGWVCQGKTPTAEKCDFDDNDCDGTSDEDFKSAGGDYTLDTHCGTCGNDCTNKFANGTGRCGGTPGSPLCIVDTCETDFVKVNDFQCSLPIDVSCQGCLVDADCSGGSCLELDGQKVCASACGAGAKSCAGGFTCKDIGAGVERCVPVTGSCVCSASNDGLTRACAVTNPAGTCYGSQVCSKDGGWTTCTARVPETEVCDGEDDDCNGAIDDALTEPAAPCQIQNDFGTCVGQWRCSDQGSGVTWWCNAATPAAEVCDYADSDCDGAVDDGFRDGASGQYVNDDHCGACGIACGDSLPNATSACVLAGTKAQCQVESCDAGYYSASPFACLPLTDNICIPCSSDTTCGSPGDLCVPLDGGNYCGRDCSAGNVHGTPEGQCPNGFECEALAGGKKQCLPKTGSCTCLVAKDAGVNRSCVSSGASGSCYGVQACDPATGWSACSAAVPSDELCDGKDNDCDAVIDDVPGRGDGCTNVNTFGSCPGVKTCAAGNTSLICQGPSAAPETCNFKDDDCDGQLDEGFATGGVCSAGEGQCATYGVIECSPDGTGVVCTAEPGAEKTEVCDGLDNDCDGDTDEGALWSQKGTICSAGSGVCQQVGVFGCNPAAPAGPLVCGAKSGTGSAEKCNGLDDDCNGQVDDGGSWSNKGETCTVGKGICLRAGVYVCDPAAPAGATICNVQAGPTAAELCDDLDNDCDGATDEPFADKGTICSTGVGSCKQFGVRVCDGSQPTLTRCNAIAGTQQTEVCDGVDNDCDASTDEGWLVAGKYSTATACGNCLTDCTTIFDLPNAYGTCNASGAPKCQLSCCKVGDTNPTCKGGDWVDVNQVPSDGCEFLRDPDAIYVSGTDPNAVDQSGCGLAPYDAQAGTYPCETIAGGLAAAVATNRSKVLVAAAAYNETVTLVAGKSLYGGYNPTTWTRDATTNLTAIFGTTGSGQRKTVIAQNITGKSTTFEGFVVYGESATGVGENSYAIWVSNCDASLVLKGNVVWAGYGGPGAGGQNGTAGTAGLKGLNGKNAYEPAGKYECAATCKAAGTAESAGGTAGTLTCGGVDASGGAGGRADCPDWDEGWQACSGCPFSVTGKQTVTTSGATAPGGGLGGAGGCDALTSACFSPACSCFAPDDDATCPNGTASLDGQNGVLGQNGGGGTGATATAGTVTTGEWTGNTGAGGQPGTSGRGGGGGGSGGGVEGGKAPNCSNGFSDIGGSGGGGGSGGCGGAAGGGGASGGASFGVFVTLSPVPATLPALTGNVVNRGVGGPGGRGGNGGNGGVGGNGGSGGNGGQAGTTFWCAGAGSKGGEGGAGGHGGGAGGGPGGPAYGLYVSGATPATWKNANTFPAGGAGGPGGQGGGSGAGGVVGTAGANGIAAPSNY